MKKSLALFILMFLTSAIGIQAQHDVLTINGDLSSKQASATEQSVVQKQTLAHCK